jgi:hypothetical protein
MATKEHKAYIQLKKTPAVRAANSLNGKYFIAMTILVLCVVIIRNNSYVIIVRM